MTKKQENKPILRYLKNIKNNGAVSKVPKKKKAS